ncbi:hypothetical protein ACFW1M_32450 [Streptomyces inhibens]|uniref:hypothetical protein n=1 Tax=Streptomyces inhibens TaxID=2293571 RepID=UPI0036C95ABC
MPSLPNEIHQQRLEQLAVFIRESAQIRADWDAYAEQHTDLDDVPHDVGAYVRRASRRDAEIWRAFNRVRPGAKALVATAETQLQHLPARAIQPRWAWQLGVLHTALDHLAVLQEEWLAIRDSLPPSARPGTWLYDDERAQRNAEAGHYIDEWASAGETVLEIHQAAQQAPSPLTITPPVPAPAPLVSASRTTRARR